MVLGAVQTAHLLPIKGDRNKSHELTSTQEGNRKNSENPKKKIKKKEEKNSYRSRNRMK